MRLKKLSWTRGKFDDKKEEGRGGGIEAKKKKRKKRNQPGEKGTRIGTKGVEESGYIKRISVGFGTNNFENWRFVCERIRRCWLASISATGISKFTAAAIEF